MISKKAFRRNTDELQNIFDFLKMNFQQLRVDQKDQFELELSVEEIFMNMVRHNDGSTKDIELLVEGGEKSIKLHLTDYEEVPFDITKTEAVDFDEYFREKKSGGLGIHLVKQFMDSITFDHQNGVSTITITKNL
ncbi:MAG: ATP-binding protein [Balneolaceae bacterium]|nr:ATP-binding protein [Balneolaceae bacterium]